MILNRIIFSFLFLICHAIAYGQVWPISSSDDATTWNRISGTFAEIHPTNGDHFHKAIDIDINTPNCPARSIDDGEVYDKGNVSIGIKHLYPSASINYFRRSRYLHVTPGVSLAVGSSVNQSDQIATIDNNGSGLGDHLHLEMWQFENGVWYKLNPLGNETNWEFASPPDNVDPEVNDVFIAGIAQGNNVPSGFSILRTGGAITNQTDRAKIHFANRPATGGAPPSASTGPVFNFNNDRLVVFGNLIHTVSVRDVDINGSCNTGCTVHKLSYQINGHAKYQLYFDRVSQNEQNNVGEIFHTEFNTNTAANSGDRLFGNNDFIELYTVNGQFLTPEKSINNVRSNGVWFTKARSTSSPIFETTPVDVAQYNGAALYEDGPQTVVFRAEDANARDVEAELKVIVDNFRPYVERVVVTKNTFDGDLSYYGRWGWSSVKNGLELINRNDNDISPTDAIHITLYTSEPMDELAVNIANWDGDEFFDATPVNDERTEFVILYNPSTTTGEHVINIRGKDLAGNDLQSNPAEVPSRQADGSWAAGITTGIDSHHYFNIGTFTCGSGSEGGRLSGGTLSGCMFADFTTSNNNPRANETITLYPIVAGNGTLAYKWNFGDGAVPATSTGSGPQSVLYTTGGAKTISLSICDGTGACVTDTQTGVVNVDDVNSFEVDFTTDRFSAYTGENIRLTSSVTGATSGLLRYSWSFGDGVIGDQSDPNPTISYTSAGNKVISLTVTDANGGATEIKNNFITISVSAFNVQPTIGGCGSADAAGNITLNRFVTGGNGFPYDTYLWDFGDGTTSTTSAGIVQHTYKKWGEYTVRLTVCDESSCGTAEEVGCVSVPSIVESSTLTPAFLVNDQNVTTGVGFMQVVGLNTPVVLTPATTGGGDPATFTNSWKLDWNIFTSMNGTNASPSTAVTTGPKPIEVYYTTTGPKSVRLTVDNGSIARVTPNQEVLTVAEGMGPGTCYANIGDITISSVCWTPGNKSRFTVPIASTNCKIERTAVYYADGAFFQAFSGTTIDFSNFPAENVPKFPFTQDFGFGVYQYDGVNYNQIGFKRQTFTIYRGVDPISVGADKQLCLGGSVTLAPSTVSTDRLYKWTSLSGPTYLLSDVNSPEPTFSALQEGVFRYRLTVTDPSCGCTATDDITITVKQPDITTNTFYTITDVPTVLNIGAVDGFGTLSYAWTPADNLSSAITGTPTFTATAQNNYWYNVLVTDTKGCTKEQSILVNVSTVPGNLVATAESYYRVKLTWMDRTSDETSFVIQRSVGTNSAYSNYATVPANTTLYEDLNIDPNQMYYYRVAHTTAAMTSQWSNEASVNTSLLPLLKFTANDGLLKGIGNFDSDDDLEVIASRNGLGIYEFKNGNFNKVRSFPESIPLQHMRAADVDSDGDQDIVIGVPFQILRNDGASLTSIFEPKILGASINAYNVIINDFDNDNDVDFLLNTNTQNGFLKLIMVKNNGNWSFTISETQVRGGDADSGNVPCVYADLNGDGAEELINNVYDIRMYLDPLNTFDNSLVMSASAPEGFNVGDFAIADYDRDMDKDILTGGDEPALIKNSNNATQFEIVRSLVSKTNVNTHLEWADFDSDGELDFFHTGRTPGQVNVSGYHLNNGGSFTKYPLTETYMYFLGDYDNDGDMDGMGYGGLIVNNNGTNLSTVNTKPSSPTGLKGEVKYLNGKYSLVLSWNPSTDTKTPSAGLTYNIWVKKGGVFLMTPLADLKTGYRKIAKPGNVDQNTSWTISLDNPSGTIEWGVQAIDNSYTGSNFSESQIICSGQITNIVLTEFTNINFTYRVKEATNVTGAADGSGTAINQKLTCTSNNTFGRVVYNFYPSSGSGSFTVREVSVTVRPPVTTVDSYATLHPEYCGSTPIEFTPTLNVPSNYIWNASAEGSISSTTVFPTMGTGPVSLPTVKNTGSTNALIKFMFMPNTSIGCGKDAFEYVVTLKPAITVNMSAGNICTPSTAKVSVTPISGSTYKWNTGATGTYIYVSQQGFYNVTVTNPAYCNGSATGSIYVKSYTNPIPYVSRSNETLCTSSSVTLTAYASGATGYTWSNGYTGSSIKVTSGGSYSATASFSNGCKTTSTALTIASCTSDPCSSSTNSFAREAPLPPCEAIEASSNEVTYYPNPANNEVKIRLPKVSDSYLKVSLYSMQGAVVAESAIKENDIETHLNTADLPAGHYLIRIKNNKGLTIGSQKIMVLHQE